MTDGARREASTGRQVLLATGVLFLLLFGPVVAVGGFRWDTMRIVGLAAVLYLSVLLFRRSVHRELLVAGSIVGLYTLYVMGVRSYAPFPDRDLGVAAGLLVLFVLASYAIAHVLVRRWYISPQTILAGLFVATAVNAALMLATFLNPSLYSLVLDLAPRGREALEALGGDRVPAINGTAGARLSSLLAIGFLAGLASYRHTLRPRWVWLGCALILLAMLVSGRTGLLLVALFGPLVPFVAFARGRHPAMAAGAFLGACLVLIGGVLGVYLGGGWLAAQMDLPLLDRALGRTFRVFRFYQEEGVFVDPTVLLLLDYHYFLPESGRDLLFGLGTLGRSAGDVGFTISSDVGFVRLIFAVGLVGSACLYMLYVVAAARGMKRANGTPGITPFLLAGTLAVAGFHAKEIGFSDPRMTSMLLVPYFAIFLGKEGRDSPHRIVRDRATQDRTDRSEAAGNRPAMSEDGASGGSRPATVPERVPNEPEGRDS
jgi:hypothetical protein